MEAAPRTLEMVLAFAVLAIAIFTAGFEVNAAWWWIAIIGCALALVVLSRAWPERNEVFAEPLTIRVTTFVVGELLMPPLVIIAGVAAVVAGGGFALDLAVVLSVMLSVVVLI